MMLTKIKPAMLEHGPGSIGGGQTFDVMSYAGGYPIGDGTSRPLSGLFGSLGAAQVVYPFVTSLDSELAWAACQAAVEAAASSGGGTVVLPHGVLVFGFDTLRIRSPYILLKGQPYYGTRITRSATTGYAVHFGVNELDSTTSSQLFYVGMANVVVTSTVPMTDGGCVLFDVTEFSLIRDCRIQNGFRNLHCRSVHDFHIENINGVHGNIYSLGEAFANLYLDQQTNTGSYIRNNNAWVSNCNFRSRDTDSGYVKHGIYISSADGIWFDHCHVGNAEEANLTIIPKTGTSQLSGLTFSNCWLDQGGGGRMVNIAGATTATFGYFQFADCYLTGGGTATDGWRISPTAGTIVRHLTITGGLVLNLKGHGFNAERLEGFSITGVQFRNVGSAGGAANGITIAGTCKQFTVTGNQVGYTMGLATASNAAYGMAVATGANSYIITGNNFLGNASGSLSDNGGPTKVVDNNLV